MVKKSKEKNKDALLKREKVAAYNKQFKQVVSLQDLYDLFGFD